MYIYIYKYIYFYVYIFKFFFKLLREFATLCYSNTTHNANFNVFLYIG